MRASLRLSKERSASCRSEHSFAAVTTLARRVLQLRHTALCDAPSAIAAKAPALVRGAVDGAFAATILDHVSKARGAPWLVPARGENIVSGERNKWRPRRRSYAKQLLLDARGQACLRWRADLGREDLESDAWRIACREALAPIDGDDIVVY